MDFVIFTFSSEIIDACGEEIIDILMGLYNTGKG